MLDTIVLAIPHPQFQVLLPERFSPSAKGLLTAPYYSLGARGNFSCVQNPTKRELRAGRYLPRLTLNNRKTSNGFAVTLRVEFSAPKLVFGNNFDELETQDFAKVLAALHDSLVGMGIELSEGVLREAAVSAIHYSKNIAFTDYTTCSMVMSELGRIDLTKQLDLSHTTYRDEGRAIRYHANSFDVLFYDKRKDLERARYSEKRGIEQNYGAQLETLGRPFLLPKELEVLRMEVRLGTRTKIRSVLRRVGVNETMSFENLFDAGIARGVLRHFWSQFRAHLPLLDSGQHPEMLLASLASATGEKSRPGKLLQQLGAIVLVNSIGFRGARAVMSRHCGQRSWQRYKRDLKNFSLVQPIGFSTLNLVDKALSSFEPIRMKSFSFLARASEGA
jgi:hypothetical protein